MTQASPDHDLLGYAAKATKYGRELNIDPDFVFKMQIVSPLESNGAVPINIQDQHSKALDLEFIQPIGDPTTLAAPIVADDRTLTLTSTAGFEDDGVVGVFTPEGQFTFAQQLGAPDGSVITVDRPMDLAYPAGSQVIAATNHMNVNGSVTPQIFQVGPVGPGTGVEVDITRIMGYLEDNVVMDDAKFGGISALARGIQVRVNNTVMTNQWNAKSNGELGLLCFDTWYTDKAPAGLYGFRFRSTYAGQEKHGVTLRLEPGDMLEIIIQDDLTDLAEFRMMAQGHVVTD